MNFKIFPVLVFFICSLLHTISLGQDRVVVIPLLESKVYADGDGLVNLILNRGLVFSVRCL
jgi:hypothetical protein